MPPLTGTSLRTLNPLLPEERAALYANVLAYACGIAALNTPQRICNFLGQVGEETGGFTSLVESTAYRDAQFLVKTFSNVQGLDHANRLIAAGPIAIGNTIYAHKNGNGDIASGDGYRYRGRGFLMITGRSNYRSIGTLISKPLEEQPELLGNPSVAAEAAAKFWEACRINVPADADDVATVTTLVNGGARLHLANRQAWHDKARAIWPF